MSNFHPLRMQNDKAVTVEKDGEKRYLRGYAAVYFNEADTAGTQYVMRFDFGGGERYEIVERLMPGAFNGADLRDVSCLWCHKRDQVLGRTTSGTLDLTRDDIGLAYRCHAPQFGAGPMAVESVHRKDVTGSSFHMVDVVDEFRKARDDEYDNDADRDDPGVVRVIREITSLGALEVSPTSFPAYTGTMAVAADRGDRNPVTLELRRLASRSKAADQANADRRRRLQLMRFRSRG